MKAKHVTIACFLVALASCRSLCQYMGIGVGAAGGSAISGPVGGGVGGVGGLVVGDKLADALGADREYTAEEYRQMLTEAHKTIADLQAREPIRVPVEVPRPFIPTWLWWAAAGLLLWLKGHHLWRLFNGGGLGSLVGVVAPSWVKSRKSQPEA